MKKINNIKNLHLGCGNRIIPGFTNVDNAHYKHIHYKKDVKSLSFIESNSVEYIYASHVLEYFDFEESIIVLKEWKRVMKKKAKIRISVPNFDSLLAIYKKTKNIDKIIGPLFGKMKSNNKFIYHKCVFSEKKLFSILKKLNFNNIKLYNLDSTFHSNYDDHSNAFYPHMNNKGIKVSINVEASK